MVDITLMPRLVMMMVAAVVRLRLLLFKFDNNYCCHYDLCFTIMVAMVVRPVPNGKYSRLLLLVFKLDCNYCCYYSCSTSETMGHLRSLARHQMLFLKAPRPLTVTIVFAGLAFRGSLCRMILWVLFWWW